jgi:TrmH family RNA methyltransferase
MKLTVVLISPETSGNIGAVARTMANFGCKDLVIVNPHTEHLNKEAMDRASHAKKILKNAKIIIENDNKKISQKIRKLGNHIIATTSKLGNDYNILRSVENIDEIANKLAIKGSKIVIMFGRESNGLTNDEISMADFAVTIPTEDNYPVMNLSHSVSICLYEFFKNANKEDIKSKKPKQAQRAEIDQLNKLVNKTIDNMTFLRETQDQTQRIVWKKLLSKLILTKREAYALMGYFKKLLNKR